MRILGITIPDEKRLEISLTTLYGVGRARARFVLGKVKIDPATKAKDLSVEQENELRKMIESFRIDARHADDDTDFAALGQERRILVAFRQEPPQSDQAVHCAGLGVIFSDSAHLNHGSPFRFGGNRR